MPKFRELSLPGVLLIEPDVFRDERGFFLETYHSEKFSQQGLRTRFVQDNHSHSSHGILRGLHAQVRHAQAKLVRVVRGSIFDVAVDIRLGSPTFGRHVAVSLSGESMAQFFIPAGFAHGFYVTSETADVEYKCSAHYEAGDEIAVQWNDPELAIPWPSESPILSEKDAAALPLAKIRPLPLYEDLT